MSEKELKTAICLYCNGAFGYYEFDENGDHQIQRFCSDACRRAYYKKHKKGLKKVDN